MQTLKLFRKDDLIGFHTPRGIWLLEPSWRGVEGNSELFLDGERVQVNRCSDPRPLALLSKRVGKKVCGTLGYNMFHHEGVYDVFIDAGSEKVCVSAEPLDVAGNSISLVEYEEQSLTVNAEVEGKRYNFFIDFGSDKSYLFVPDFSWAEPQYFDFPFVDVELGHRTYRITKFIYDDKIRRLFRQTNCADGVLGLAHLLESHSILFSRNSEKLTLCRHDDPVPDFLAPYLLNSAG